jgi:predicted transcriptional regulator
VTLREMSKDHHHLLAAHRQPSQSKGNRGKIEIIGDILSVCLAGNAKRTHIMYKGNLSHDMLKTYTDELVGKGLVEVAGSKGQFKTTEKGREFLDHYGKIRELLAAEILQQTPKQDYVTHAGTKLISLGMSQEFLDKVKISSDQARDIMKGMLYLNERYKAKDTRLG